MSAGRFFLYELRSSDPDAARVFSAEVLGTEFWNSDSVNASRLPEGAAAAGAPSHWLGHIGVRDVEGTVDRIIAFGGARLGPRQSDAGDSARAVLRDPFGAVLALGSDTLNSGHRPVTWHLHHSQDHQVSFAWYGGFFGWAACDLVNLGPETHQMFAWAESEKTVGSMTDMARRGDIHAQWLFFFPVADIERSLAKVCALGGSTLGAMQTAHHDLVAPCNDPQGAAFALYQCRAITSVLSHK
jgi:predicted enzyme related to lactoylglutathione lyase